MTKTITLAKYILPKYSFACRRKQQVELPTDDPHVQRAIGMPCKSRGCPICRRVWEARKDVEIRFILERATGQLYRIECSRFRWKSLYYKIRRRGGGYFAAEIQPGLLSIVTDADVPGSDPIRRADARDLMRMWARDARPVKKPVLISTAWKIPKSEEQKGADMASKPNRRKGTLLRQNTAFDFPRGMEVEDFTAAAEELGIPYSLDEEEEDGDYGGQGWRVTWDLYPLVKQGLSLAAAKERFRDTALRYANKRNQNRVTDVSDGVAARREAFIQRFIGKI